MKSRLAPTPSGWLHIGNGASFVLTWALVRAAGGQLLLRIDDIDKGRRRQEYLEDIFRTIDWLGINYDEGPSGVEDFLANWSQHHRLSNYQQAFEQLWQQGKLYACQCSRKEWQAISTNHLYPGTCRHKQLAKDQNGVAWRIAVQKGWLVEVPSLWEKGQKINLATTMGDFVLRKKDGLPAYQIVSLIDDLQWGIDTIIRGADLLHSTAAQLYLAAQLGHSQFLQNSFLHHPLLLDDRGQKLSKSEGAPALYQWRAAGKSPYEIYQMVAKWLDAEFSDIRSLTDLVHLAKTKLEI